MADSIYALQQQFAAQDATKATPTVGSDIAGATKYFTDLGSQTKKNDARNLVLMQARMEKNKQMVAAEQVGNAQEKQTELYTTALNQAKDAYARGNASNAVAIAKNWSNQNQGIAQVYKNIGDEQAVQKTEASKNETYLKFLANARTKSSNDIISKFQASIVGQDPTITPEKLQSDINSKVQEFMVKHPNISTEQKTSLLTQLHSFSNNFDANSKQTNLNIKDQQDGTRIADTDAKKELSSLVPGSRPYYDKVESLIDKARKQNWSKNKYDAYVGHFAGVKYDAAKDNKAKINSMNAFNQSLVSNKEKTYTVKSQPTAIKDFVPKNRTTYVKNYKDILSKYIKEGMQTNNKYSTQTIKSSMFGMQNTPVVGTIVNNTELKQLKLYDPNISKVLQTDSKGNVFVPIKYLKESLTEAPKRVNDAIVQNLNKDAIAKNTQDKNAHTYDLNITNNSLNDTKMMTLPQYIKKFNATNKNYNYSSTDIARSYQSYKASLVSQQNIVGLNTSERYKADFSDINKMKKSYQIYNNPDALDKFKKQLAVSGLPQSAINRQISKMENESTQYGQIKLFKKNFGSNEVSVTIGSRNNLNNLVSKGLDPRGFGRLWKSISSNKNKRNKLQKMFYDALTDPKEANELTIGPKIEGKSRTMHLTNFKMIGKVAAIARKVSEKYIKEESKEK